MDDEKEIEEFAINEKEKREKNIRSKITFELVDPNYVKVLLCGKEVGSFWSELGSKNDNFRFPFPHNNEQIDKIQICGFDDCSQVWGCGRYEGKKDLVLTFVDTVSDEYWEQVQRDYSNYLKKKLEKGNLKDVQSFHDFHRHNIGQFREK